MILAIVSFAKVMRTRRTARLRSATAKRIVTITATTTHAPTRREQKTSIAQLASVFPMGDVMEILTVQAERMKRVVEVKCSKM